MDQLRSQVWQLKAAAERRGEALRERRRRLQRRALLFQAGLVLANVLGLAIAVSGLLAERSAGRRAAELQAKVTEEIGRARRAAEEADRAKSRFLAAASHDMRQPLHALALYISALERRVEGAQAREILANMDGAVRAMTRLFTALLDMARLEAGVLRPEPIDFPVGELLQEVANHSLDFKGRSDVQVVVVPTRLAVRTDPDLLEIVLRNLASNAVKHSKGGRVLLGCRRVGADVRIEVRDDGEGIPEHELHGLFGEFVRGEGARSTEGVGLGLSIVHRMAELLGHKLSVRSEVGRGSVFAITVPRAAAEPPAAASAPAPAPARARGAMLDGARILVADDDPLALDAMARALADAGAEVARADTAARAKAQAAQGFDLYVFDMNLGAENGLALLTELERARGGPVRALVVTGATTAEALAALRGSGRAWLTKPLAAETLVAKACGLLAA
jgi:histidine kinase